MAKTDVILIAFTRTWKSKWVRCIYLRVIPRLTEIGAVGEQSEPKEKTTLADKIKKYDSVVDAPDKKPERSVYSAQISGDLYYDEFVLQQDFIKRCRNEEEFNLRV